MNAVDILERASAAGVQVMVRNGELKARGPSDALSLWAPALRPHKAELLALLAEEVPEPRPDWRVFAQAYHEHHFGCAGCIAAGKGYGSRCPVGLVLWATYQEASNDQ